MEKRTVFIVGAGASYEFDLPVGPELARKISRLAKGLKFDRFGNQTAGDSLLAEAVRKLSAEFQDVQFTEELRKVAAGVLLSPSIDNYLHAHSENFARVKLGKLLISFSLLEAERASKLYFDPQNIYDGFDFSRVSETWLAVLFRTLVTAGNLESLTERMQLITFVSFNYDRIIERFFFLAIQTLFDLDEARASEFCEENLDIYYPYGSLGTLRSSAANSGFGQVTSVDQLMSASQSLKLFTEGANRATNSIVRQKVLDAESIFFLGFSFLKLNMDYLKPIHETSLDVFGTSFGLSEYNTEIAKNRISTWFVDEEVSTSEFSIESLTCAKFLESYSGFFE